MLIKRKRRRLITIEDSDDSVKSKGERDFLFFIFFLYGFGRW